MFAGGINLLSGSSIDIGNIAVPRPNDALAERLNQAALEAMRIQPERMTASERMREPEKFAQTQHTRRETLESLFWTEPNQAVLMRMADLIDLICAENSWSRAGAWFDDPSHPAIDLQAAETGMLLAWLLRRHGAKLIEISARIPVLIQGEIRRRLLAPILAHNDYPFMNADCQFPALILSDLLLCCVMTETLPSRRQQPLKKIMHLLDRLIASPVPEEKNLTQRLADACALIDLARLLKRLTRGELDYTGSVPPEAWLDDALIPWISEGCFIDPMGEDMQPPLSGMDYFRLGYVTRDRALSALGAQLRRARDIPAFSLCGRILSMDFVRAIQDELSAPPKLKRAVTPDGGIMLSRVGALTAVIMRGGKRCNSGDIALFCDGKPIFADFGGADGMHCVPMIGIHDQLKKPLEAVQTDYSFEAARDIMSADLTGAYPENSGLSAYQRTLMTMRGDGTVRLVDAFEFVQPPREIIFRFICAHKPLSLRDSVRIGDVDMTWDGGMKPEIFEPDSAHSEQGWLLQFTLRDVPRRLICGFTFEAI